MKIMAMLPTFNEAANIEPLIAELLALPQGMEVIVVDDNSPDGTWKIVNDLAEKNPRVHLIHRTDKRGRGSAGVAGFQFACERNADLIIEMDADFSHQPRFIPAMIEAARQADVVIGSRLVTGGGETGRSPIRCGITRLGNRYAQLVLGLPVRDCTSGFRVYHRRVLKKIGLEKMESNGPAIVQEILMACMAHGFSFIETPILFEERRAGDSTFNLKILLRGVTSVWRFRFRNWNVEQTNSK